MVDDTEQLSIKCLRGELDGSVIFSIYSSKLIHGNSLTFPSGYYEDISFAYNAMLLAQSRYISQNFWLSEIQYKHVDSEYNFRKAYKGPYGFMVTSWQYFK